MHNEDTGLLAAGLLLAAASILAAVFALTASAVADDTDYLALRGGQLQGEMQVNRVTIPIQRMVWKNMCTPTEVVRRGVRFTVQTASGFGGVPQFERELPPVPLATAEADAQ